MKKMIVLAVSAILAQMLSFGQNTLTIRAYMDAPGNGKSPERYAKVLWYDEGTDEYFVSKTPYSKPKKIFTFEQRDGGPSRNYAAAFLPSGDVLFVYDSQFGAQKRGEKYTKEEEAAPYNVAKDNKYRKDPIIAVAKEAYRQHVIEFGDRLKPTGWLQNVGQHWSFRHNAFYFAEYTRGNVSSCNGWKVSGDITDPDNWRVRASRPVDFPYKSGTKHFHIAQEDPFTGVMYYSTGDSNAGLYAAADGENFVQLDKNDRAKWRMLNAVFTEEYVWWASDDWAANHRFWRCSRGSDGVIDPETLKLVYRFPYSKGDGIATYGNIYFQKYNAILFLDRWDWGGKTLPVYLYDIDKEEMIHITDLKRHDDLPSGTLWGFRCRTMEMYPTSSQAVVSFDTFHPYKLHYNLDLSDEKSEFKNLILKLSKDKQGNYILDFGEVAPKIGK